MIETLVGYVLPFLVVLTVLVFVHEMGHYLVARLCGVGVEVFSIGFGRELFGWHDRHGTRWRISMIPFGGYVKFHGDMGPASRPEQDAAAVDDPQNFHSKPLAQRAAVVVAGPAANFLFAIVIFAMMFVAFGQVYTPARVSEVLEGSPAAHAGLQPGDLVVGAGGSSVEDFKDLQRIMALNLDRPITLTVERGGRQLSIDVKPELARLETGIGGSSQVGRLGIRATGGELRELGPGESVAEAVNQTWVLTRSMLSAIGDMVLGVRSLEELRGPAGIAHMSGEAAQFGIATLINFAAFISVSLGLINLFPIPMLDGGHLLFYAVEAVRGRPLGESTQEIGYRIGLAMVLGLMLFATFNDVVQFGLVDYVSGLFS